MFALQLLFEPDSHNMPIDDVDYIFVQITQVTYFFFFKFYE